MGALDQYETSRSRSADAEDLIWIGERTFEIPTSAIAALSSEYEPTRPAGTWPGERGIFAPQLRKYRLDRPAGRAAHAELICWYRRPTWDELVRDQPNRAVVFIDLSGDAIALRRELIGDNRVIQGPDKTNAKAKWEVVEGSNQILLPSCAVRVRTAAARLDLLRDYALLGKTNDAPLPNFGTEAKDLLLFLGLKAQRMIWEPLWLLDYFFLFNPNGFTSACKSQKYLRKCVEMDKFAMDADGEIAEDVIGKTTVLIWAPEGDPEARDATRGAGNFAWLHSMTSWYL